MIAKSSEIKWYHLLPLLFILAVNPLIVRLKVVHLVGANYYYWTGAQNNFDFFSYEKGVLLLVAAFLGLIIYLFKLYGSKFTLLKKELIFYYLLIGVYLVFLIASTLHSDYLETAIRGFPDRYEGVFIILAYIVIFCLTINFVNSVKHIKLMIGALLLGAFMIGTIGLFQFWGFDLWKSDIGRLLSLPLAYRYQNIPINFYPANHSIYSTLYHMDYVGSYMAMLFPFCFALFILVENKQFKIGMGLISLLLAINWFGSNSRAGIVGGGIAIITFIILVNRFLRKYFRYFLLGVTGLILLFYGLNHFSSGYLSSKIYSLLSDTKYIFVSNGNESSSNENLELKSISIEDNMATLITKTETLRFINNNQKLIFKDNENKPIEATYSGTDGKVVLNNTLYQDYNLILGKMGDKKVLKITKGKINLLFDLKREGISVISPSGNSIDLKPVKSWGFKGKEKLGSSRGYIWSRSIPLLKNTVFLGFGPDTFAMYFPQNDIIGKLYAYDTMWSLVDKPHNLYLQIALNTGIISLLSFLFLLGLYFIESIKLFALSDYYDPLNKVGVSIFVSVVGYLGAAFFNDSVVSVAPVFWIMLGLGVSINHMIKFGQKETIES